MIKNLSAMKETQVWSLGWEDPLEKEIATPSSILAWRILWTEEPGGLQFMGSQRIGHARVTNTFTLSRLQMTGVKPLASMWGGASIKLQIIVKTIVGVTESNIGLKNRKKKCDWVKRFVCIASDIHIELGYRMLRLEIQVWMLGEREGLRIW